jgi:uncharacterized protein (DUF2237 family)
MGKCLIVMCWAAADLGLHTICAVVTAEFLEHQRSIGNDLLTPMPHFRPASCPATADALPP